MSTKMPQPLNFHLKITQFGPNSFFVEVDSPAGSAEGTFALPFEPEVLRATLDSYRENIKETRHASESQLRALLYSTEQILTPEEVGGRLFEAVFQKEIKNRYQQSRRQARQERRPLLFKLEIEPIADELINLPWEYLFDPGQGVRGEFFAFNAETPIIRRWAGQEPRPFDPISPMRVLIVSARPKGDEAGLANLQREAKAVKTQLRALNIKGEKKVEIEHLEAASLAELGDILRDPNRSPHVLHFIGHGNIGALLFEEQYTGESLMASENTLTIMLGNALSLRLVVLNACRTARADRLQNQLGVAQSLADKGIPAILAMQFNISDDAAEIFAGEFYKVIAEGRSIDQAVTWGRIKIQQKFQNDAAREWGTPVLYLQTEEGHIFSDLIQKQEAPGKTEIRDTLEEDYVSPPPVFAPTETVATQMLELPLQILTEITDTEQARQQAEEVTELVAHYRKLLKIHLKNLQTLKEQEAQFGIEASLSILNGIQKEEEAIKEIEAKLAPLVSDGDPDWPDSQVIHSGRTKPVKPVSVNVDTDAIKRIAPSIRDQVTQMYGKGNSALQASDWGEAVKLLSRAQKLSADLPNIDQMVERARQEWKRTSEGRTQYLTLNAQYDLAQTNIANNAWDDAAMLLESIVNTDAGYKNAYDLSLQTREKADKEKAEKEKQARLADLYQQAQSAFATPNWTEAVNYLTQIMEIDPTYKDGEVGEMLKKATRQRDMQEAYTQGKRYYERKEWAKAVADLGKVSSMDEEGQYPDVKAMLEESRHQKQLDSWIKEAEAYIDQGSWEEAIKILVDHEVTPERLEGFLAYHYALALRFQEQKAWDQAVESLKQVMQTRPNYRPDLETLYQKATQQSRLAHLFQEAIGFISKDDWGSAKARLEQILKIEYDYPEVEEKLQQVNEEIELQNLYEQAEKLMKLKQWAEAIPIWKEILEKSPQGYDQADKKLVEAQDQLELNTYYRQGVEAAGRGDWAKARGAFAQVMQKAPNFRDVQAQLKNAEDKITLGKAFAEGIDALDRGKNNFNPKQLETAISQLQTACEIDPRYKGAANRLSEAKREYKLLKHYLDGQNAFNNNRWTEAVDHWKKLVEEEGQPDYHSDAAQNLAEAERLAQLDSLYQKAHLAQKDQDWDQVIILLKQIAGDPAFPEAADQLVEAEMQQQLFAAFNQALQARVAENWTEVIHKLEFIKEKRSSYREDDVTELLNQAKHFLTLEKTYADGMAAVQKQDWETARRRFEQVYNIDSDYRDVETRLLQARQQQTLSEYYQEGETAYQAREWEEANTWFSRIQDIDPDYRDAKERLAKVQLQQQLALDYQEAIKKFEAENWLEAAVLLKTILSQQQPYQQAEAKLAEAEKQIKLAQKYTQAQESLKKGLWAEAVTLLTEITGLDPDYKDTSELLKLTQKEKTLDESYKRVLVLREVEEQWAEALMEIQKLITLEPNYKDVVNLKYELQAKIRQAEIEKQYHQAEGILDTEDESRWDEGIQRLERLLANEPDFEKAQRRLDQARQRRGERVCELRQQIDQAKDQRRWTQALEPMQRLVNLETNNPKLKAELNQIKQAQQEQYHKKRNQIMLGGVGVGLLLACAVIAVFVSSLDLFRGGSEPTPTGTLAALVSATSELISTLAPSPTLGRSPTSESTPTPIPTPSPALTAEKPGEPTPIPSKELSVTLTPVPTEVTSEEATSTLISPPDSVTNLQATGVTSSSVTLNWLLPKKTYTKLVIQRNGEVLDNLPTNSEIYTVEGLDCGTTYNFDIIVFNDAEAAVPAQVSVTTSACQSETPQPTGKIAVPVFNKQTNTYDIYVAGAVNNWQPILVFEGGSQPDFSPDGQKIVARSWGENRYNLAQKLVIFSLDPASLQLINVQGSIREMTFNVEDAHPAWRKGSNEGDILFHSKRGTGYTDLFLLGTSPGIESTPDNQRNMGTGENPDWLGIEKYVFFSNQGGEGVWIADLNGAERKLIYESPQSLAPAGALDGDSIAVSLPIGGDWWNIYHFSASAGQASKRQLTSGDFHDWLPTWSPDGNYVAFVSDRDNIESQWSVWIIAANEENPQPIRLFSLSGSPQGIVDHAQGSSRGWGEERISWGP